MIMSSQIPKVAYIPSAEKSRNLFNLSNDNITTSDFFRIKPSRIIECCPREKFSLQTETLIRMRPLAVPTFGRCNHYLRWFWVPCRTLMRGWNEFISQVPYYDAVIDATGLINTVPIFTNADICQMFKDSDDPNPGWLHGVLTDSVPSGVTTDVTLASSIDNQGHYTTQGIKFSKIGRAFVDTLQNLGYNINWSFQDQTPMSALPLLAYMRVMADYYLNPQYINLAQQLFSLKNGNLIQYLMSHSNIANVFFQLFPGYSNFDPDYFVSAWDNPIAPNNLSSNPNIEIDDITLKTVSSDHSKVSLNNTFLGVGTPFISRADGQSPSPVYLSDYIVKSLRIVTNYAIRNNIAGYKFWDRLEAEYGSVMDYKEKGTSLYIDTDVTNIQISPVVSQSDTQGAALGDLGGYGLGSSQMKQIDFETKDEFGYLIAMSSIVPVIGYYQGTKRENMHISPLHFFRPDFDSQGVQPINVGEVFSSQFAGDSFNSEILNSGVNNTVERDKIFGYSPRYSEYKVACDTLSGDFRVYSKASGGDVNAYHLMREVANEFDYGIDGYDVKHDPAFCRGDNTQFDRIFSVPDNGKSDHFILIHHHKVEAWRNMKSMAETIFDDEELEHNKKVEIPYNGSQMN